MLENSLTRGSKIDRKVVSIHGITGDIMETKGQIELCVGETSFHEFMVVEKLPTNCEILFGQDWLERFGYQFQIPNSDIALPAYSETFMRIPVTEKGSSLVESQDLKENVFCASSLLEWVDSSFLCLIINCDSTDGILKRFPQTEELPKLGGNFPEMRKSYMHSRNQVLQTHLRLTHVKEVEHEIRQICAEYMAVFKLPGVN